jgi:two-component sensor histidine kinase
MALLSVFLFRLFKQNQTQKIQLAQSVKDKDYLLREIHHRVKNNLQVISSLLYLQSEKLTDSAAQDAINVGRGRVKSMALIHQNLYGVNQSSEINLKKYLEDLAEELFDSYNLRSDDISLNLDIETAVVDVDLLVPLGLILNELISNALKYAFEGKEKGVLSISAKKQNETIHVQVKDDGVGINPSDIEKDSFGTELIQSFVEQLDAKIETIVAAGTEVNLLIPLNVEL